jgi:Polyphosphate kinase 2 (PPK2)
VPSALAVATKPAAEQMLGDICGTAFPSQANVVPPPSGYGVGGRQWKRSPVDLAALERWDDYTRAKERMFARTDTAHAPWTVVKSNDKKRGRIAALSWVLSQLDYPTKDEVAVGTPDPLLVGPPAQVYEASERLAAPVAGR